MSNKNTKQDEPIIKSDEYNTILKRAKEFGESYSTHCGMPIYYSSSFMQLLIDASKPSKE